MQGLRGPVPTVTPEQVRQARLLIDAGGSISSAARTLNLSRSSLVRAMGREHLTNKDVKAETAAMKLRLDAAEAELTELRAWRDKMMARVLAATDELAAAQ